MRETEEFNQTISFGGIQGIQGIQDSPGEGGGHTNRKEEGKDCKELGKV